jgi:streptogramin lyase/tRNA A-37 threonylcarbamoyl transferase component Bud32
MEAGSELAGYRIESVIGRGGMGVVYLAEHLRLKRKVALKVLAPELAADERFRERFVQESELAASLDHPNIVTVHDAGEADGLLYIAMRLVEGIDLKTLVQREEALDPARTVSIVSQLASALDAAHARGLIHRDVKPANVLVTPGSGGTDVAFLTDFGLTKRPDQTTGITRTGQFMGSVDYAAPEQFEGKPLDARTDVYSLACLAFECLTGRVPYPRDQEAAVMFAHLKAPPPRIAELRRDISSRVDAVVSRGMAKKPADRYDSAGRFATALRGSLVPDGQTSPATARRPRRRVLLLAGGTLVALVLVALFAVLSHRSGYNPRDTPSPGASATSVPNPAAGLVGVIRLDPSTGTTIPIEAPLAASDVSADKSIVIGGSSVWLYDSQAGTLYRISPETNRVVNQDRFRSGSEITYGHDALWMAPLFFDASQQLRRINPTTFSVDADVPVRDGSDCCTAIAFGDDRVWVLGSAVLRGVDPVTQAVQDFPVSGTALAASPRKVWVLDISGQLIPFDANSLSPGPAVPLPTNPVAVAVSADAVWVLQKGAAGAPGQVQKIPLVGGGGIQTVAVGSRPNDIVVAPDGSVWVACFGDGTVWEIDPIAVTARSFRVGGHPSHIAVDDDGVWIVSEFPTNAFGL